MRRRFFLFSFVCVLALAFVQREEGRGLGDAFTDGHIGWLRANGDDHEQEEELPITMVTLDDGDVSPAERIFQSWPHSELDYSLILTNLASARPHTVVIEPALAWPEDGAPFLSSLAHALEALPHRVLGTIGEFSDYIAGEEGGDSQKLSAGHLVLSDVQGDLEKLPAFTHIIASPVDDVAHDAVLALTDIDLGAGIENPGDGTLRIPLMARAEGDVVATLPLVALLRYLRVAEDRVAVQLGKAVTAPGVDVPIDDEGYYVLHLDSLVELQKLSAGIFALALDGVETEEGESPLVGSLVKSDADFSKLENLATRLVMIGEDDKRSRRFEVGKGRLISRTEVFCQTIAAMTSGDRLKRSPAWVGWMLAGLAFVVGLFQLRLSRSAILKVVVGVLLPLAISSLILYETYHVWFPVLRALVVLASGTVVAFLCADKKRMTNDGGSHSTCCRSRRLRASRR